MRVSQGMQQRVVITYEKQCPLKINNEGRLYRSRDDQEWEHDGEVLLLRTHITLSHGPTE
jgi:hypothetical protein